MAARLQEPGRAITAGSSIVARSRYHGIFQLLLRTTVRVCQSVSLSVCTLNMCICLAKTARDIESWCSYAPDYGYSMVWYSAMFTRKNEKAHPCTYQHTRAREPGALASRLRFGHERARASLGSRGFCALLLPLLLWLPESPQHTGLQ